MKKMLKKCSTDQRFIRKGNTTYKIGTLVYQLFYHILLHFTHFITISSGTMPGAQLAHEKMYTQTLFWFGVPNVYLI